MGKISAKITLAAFFCLLSFGVFAASYTPSAALSYSNQSNITIDAKSFTTGVSGASIYLTNCTNVKIINCKFTLTKDIIGVQLNNCSNVEIAGCYFENFRSGVYAVKCTGGIDINCNSFKNIAGAIPRGQMVQFNQCYGTGNRVNYNILDHTYGTGNPEDLINMYGSYGTAADPIQIIGNKLRGGGPSTSGGGIMIGDNGGHDIRVEDNILVDVGQYGIGCPAGYNMTIKNNQIYGASQPWTNVGLYVGLQGEVNAGFPCNGSTIVVQNNKVKFFNKAGVSNGWYPCPCCPGIVQSGNDFKAPIDASILPAVLVLNSSACSIPAPSVTLAATKTRTPVNTYTYTRTVTRTITKTFTPTVVNTRTATPANTKTNTPSASITGTFTALNTKTHTPSYTATAANTFSATPSRTKTVTKIFTVSPSFTLTLTCTFTLTAVVSPSRTFTPQETFTATVVPPQTAAPTLTSLPSGTATVSVTFDPSKTASPTLTTVQTGTATATNTKTTTTVITLTNTPVISFTATATVSIEATSTFTAPSATATSTVMPAENGVLAFEGDTPLYCYPNPAATGDVIKICFNIKGSADMAEIYIYTVHGRLIRKKETTGAFHEGLNTIALEKGITLGLANGTYYYTVKLSNGITVIQRKGIMIKLR